MGFYIQDDFWESLEEESIKTQNEVFGSLVRLYFTKDDKPNIKGSSKSLFIAFRDRVSIARKKSDAGKTVSDKNDDQNDDQNAIKPKSKAGSNSDQNEIKPEGHLLKGESESKKDPKEPPLPPLDDHDSEAAAFAVEALAVFNSITESDIRDMPGDAWCGLRRIFEAGRTIDDVRAVVDKMHAEWKDDKRMDRFVRPSTLFGEKFEEYLKASKGGSGDAETSEYSGLF